MFEADVCGLVGFVVLVSNDHLNLGPWTFTVDADSVSHKTSCTWCVHIQMMSADVSVWIPDDTFYLVAPFSVFQVWNDVTAVHSEQTGEWVLQEPSELWTCELSVDSSFITPEKCVSYTSCCMHTIHSEALLQKARVLFIHNKSGTACLTLEAPVVYSKRL